MNPAERSSDPPRIASLLPAATELVCALGFGDSLVGISHECDWPPELAGTPALTRSRLGLPGAGAAFDSSGKIDEDLRALLEQALSVYTVDGDALARAAPDLIVTQSLCEVCALPREEVERAVNRFLGPDVRIVDLAPKRLADIWEDARRIAAALDAPDRAEECIGAWLERIERVRELTRGQPSRPAVLTIEWLDPVMVGGLWMPELVELAGGRALAARAGEHAPTLSRGQLARLDPAPEVVLLKPCGYALERTLAEAELVASLLDPLPWPAIRDGAVWVADGNAFFNRPGPRIVESLELLAACVHPQACADLRKAFGPDDLRPWA